MRQGKVVILPMILVAVLVIAALIFGLLFIKDKIIKKVIIEENSLLFILKCGLPLREVIAWD